MKQIKNIYRQEWEYFKTKIARPTLICGLIFIAAALLYYVVAMQNMTAAQEAYKQISDLFKEKGFFDQMATGKLLGMIFVNNALAGFFVLIMGLVPFIFAPLWTVVSNAALCGVVIAVSQNSGLGAGDILMSLLPHGLFELPAFCFTAGLGWHMCLLSTKKFLVGTEELVFLKNFGGLGNHL